MGVTGKRSMTISVVLASCRHPELVRASVAGLLPQCRDAGAELIVARRTSTGDPDPQDLLTGCRLVECPMTATIPQLRGAGLAAAAGDYVLLTEDNCIPGLDWVSRLRAGFGDGADVVGGTMDNAKKDRAVDRGAFFAEYGFFGRRRTTPGGGASPYLTGANVAYRRTVLAEAAAWALGGAWEGEIHHRLADRGARFALVHDAIVEQNLDARFAEFCRERFIHGRDYGLVRAAGWPLRRRVAMACATPLLPPLMTWRAWLHSGRADAGGFLSALPWTLTFFSAWATGEAVAYLKGASR